MDEFWRPRLPVNRPGTDWLKVVKTLVCWRTRFNRGSEVRLFDLTSTYVEERPTGDRRAAPIPLQPRQGFGLRPGGHRADRHARGTPAGP